ncbi:carbohydrate ABC transporter permease [Candidatus Halobonum tyrrellensis]|uniref:Sugar ABC transporter permease n=1 Tax=Candidatus Halobonum tyrrellensis G22 TaxID=1324957 RepID=V4GYF2_9EURY|nr:sugar ABC transporter permease [Candidatus Halobonum tyrrellensis]ESP90216.1 sugar ABC transporter permease [Candidatus Halobonum tyrrellensis G22]
MKEFFERVRRATSGRSADRGAGADGSDPEESDGPAESGAAVTDGGVATGSDRGGTTGDDPGALRRAFDRIDDRLGRDFVESSPFWLPAFLLMGFFVYGAIGWNVLISLTDYRGFGTVDYSQLDFDMYVRAFQSSAVQQAAINTFVLLLGFTIVCLIFGMLLAILLDRRVRYDNSLRLIYLLPMSLSFVVTAQFWLWMYDYSNGIVNQVLGLVGLGPYNFIGNPQLVLGAVIFALVWQYSGYAMVVYLSALRAIPDEHFEAAKVDGASVVRMYWRVIVPQLRSATISAAVVIMVFALKAFDFLYSLVGGYRPPNGADILATLMVREAYQNTNWAYGSAIAVILFMMALAVIGPYLVYQYRNDAL